MNHFAVKRAMSTMTVLCDTREQDTPRSRKRFQAIGVPIERTALSFGDYSVKCNVLDLRDRVAIERKMDLSELAHCYCQDRKRFVREFERAKEAGAKLYLLEFFSVSATQMSQNVEDKTTLNVNTVSYTHLDVYKRQVSSPLFEKSLFPQAAIILY